MNFVASAAQVQGELLTGQYDPWLVLASYLIASAAAFVALQMISELRNHPKRAFRGLLLVAAALSLGGGIWSMHFVAMLAFDLFLEVRYSVSVTVASLVMPVIVSGAGLWLIREGPVGRVRLAITGTLLGLSICAMHYTGMAAMMSEAMMFYRLDLFLVSVGVAIAAATTALWVGLRFSSELGGRLGWLYSAAAALVMGIAVAGMHYTGMAATVFVRGPVALSAQGFALDAPLMAFGISATVIIIFALSLLIAGIDENLSGKHRMGLLVLLMAVIAVGVGGIALAVIYDGYFQEQRNRVVELARSQARLIEAVSRFDARYSANDMAGGAFAATLSQVADAHSQLEVLGPSGEVNLGRIQDDTVVYLLPRRHPQVPRAKDLPYDPDAAMRRALTGASGTMVTRDYRGARVLAAFEPINMPDRQIGIVVKLDLAEFRGPFIQAGIASGVGAVLLILIGVTLSRGIGNPLLRQLEEKERIEVELSFARSVQEDLLPEHPPQRDGLAVAARTVPARFVGGDFYDFLEIDEDRLGIIVGDVSGKGMSAALYMARLLGDFRYLAKLHESAGEVLTQMNLALSERSSQGMFASAIYVVVDVRSRTLYAANAGHHPLHLLRDEQVSQECATASGPPLGMLAEHEFATDVVTLEAGDALIMFTDGATEPHNDVDEEFGVARLIDIALRQRRDPDALINEIETAIASFTGHAPMFDDFTVVALIAR